MTDQPLKFKVAPHIVQDLGLNLYTSLPRVLVEFIANAYDADSSVAEIVFDVTKIKQARNKIKGEWETEDPALRVPLGERVLGEEIQIIITDRGHGMSRGDLQNKFLVAGRRRREEERNGYSNGGRLLMGRKGLGKLAGFGIARQINIITKTAPNSKATQITLDYDALLKNKDIHEIEVPEKILQDDGGLGEQGTRVILSKLVYEPMKSRMDTIANAIGDHFLYVEADDFLITLNSQQVEPTPRKLAYAYPHPEKPLAELIEKSYITEDSRSISFRYRIRFTASGHHLDAKDRGVRVYAHKRLAAAPSLLDLRTGIHGFRNTEYLDGIVHADFIDNEERVDYVATDRQALRWDSYLLAPMREFLTQEMITACNEYQKRKDADAAKAASEDDFTKDLINAQGLPAHRKRLAYRVAGMLASVCQDGNEGEEYKQRLPIFLDGLGQGDILRALSGLAKQDRPEIGELILQVAELTSREFGDFARFVQGRLDGIQALQKLYEGADFKAGNNENQLHMLFNQSPWLVDPTFTQFLTSNESENELNKRLARYLEIGPHSPKNYNSKDTDETMPLGGNKRPDLVFLLSNEGLLRLVIIELKAPNTPLHNDHLTQLKGYIRRTRQWMAEQSGTKARYTIEGYLIGSKADPVSRAEKVEQLRYEIENRPSNAEWMVFDIGEVLERTKLAHQELLSIYQRAAKLD